MVALIPCLDGVEKCIPMSFGQRRGKIFHMWNVDDSL